MIRNKREVPGTGAGQKFRCHAHRYRRYMMQTYKDRIPGRRPIWTCLDCSHYLYNPEQVTGRTARCYVCYRLFEVMPQHLRTSGFEKSGLSGEEGWRVKILCGGDCKDNRKQDAGLGGDLSLEELMKKSVKDALEPSRSDSEQEHGLLADLVRQAKGE